VRVVKGVARFWYDFLVGDDWKIAAAVVAVLGAGAALAVAEVGVNGSLLVPLLALAVAAAFALSLLVDVKRRT
jgi:hypothetical protein